MASNDDTFPKVRLLCPEIGQTPCSHQYAGARQCNTTAVVEWQPAKNVGLRFCGYHWARLVNSECGRINALQSRKDLRKREAAVLAELDKE